MNFANFTSLFVALSICIFCLRETLLYFSRKISLHINKIGIIFTEIASALGNKELPSHFRVYRKSASSSQTDGRIATGGPLYTGY